MTNSRQEFCPTVKIFRFKIWNRKWSFHFRTIEQFRHFRWKCWSPGTFLIPDYSIKVLGLEWNRYSMWQLQYVTATVYINSLLTWQVITTHWWSTVNMQTILTSSPQYPGVPHTVFIVTWSSMIFDRPKSAEKKTNPHDRYPTVEH